MASRPTFEQQTTDMADHGAVEMTSRKGEAQTDVSDIRDGIAAVPATNEKDPRTGTIAAVQGYDVGPAPSFPNPLPR